MSGVSLGKGGPGPRLPSSAGPLAQALAQVPMAVAVDNHEHHPGRMHNARGLVTRMRQERAPIKLVGPSAKSATKRRLVQELPRVLHGVVQEDPVQDLECYMNAVLYCLGQPVLSKEHLPKPELPVTVTRVTLEVLSGMLKAAASVCGAHKQATNPQLAH